MGAYSNKYGVQVIRVAVKHQNSVSEFFSCSKEEVIQGCMPFPALFNLFPNDLPGIFQSTEYSRESSTNGRALKCLLYVNELGIFSKTATGLQNHVTKLNTYCKTNQHTRFFYTDEQFWLWLKHVFLLNNTY